MQGYALFATVTRGASPYAQPKTSSVDRGLMATLLTMPSVLLGMATAMGLNWGSRVVVS